jgi:2-succinyl-5-enolpyruvyl-6-hydroxy-3-cyclohexene-1-carboxylate synthase
LVVAGWGSGSQAQESAFWLGWPLLADAISGNRSSETDITAYEALLRVPGFAATHRPDLVVRFGAALTSKTATAWLDASIPQIVVDPDGAWLDPQRAAGERVAALPDLRDLGIHGMGRWYDDWQTAEELARQALDDFLDADDQPFEGRVARDVAAVCADRTSALVVASSMPVRDLEAFAGRVPNRVLSNRGVNGIDGFNSTLLGVAAVAGPAVGLSGDLAFLHDVGGFYGAARRDIDAVLVVVDNDGGGIFNFLPQAELPQETFETIFGTPHGLDLIAVAGSYGLPAERVTKAGDLAPALHRALEAGGVQVIVVPTGDRRANVDRHRQAWAAVARAVARGKRSG